MYFFKLGLLGVSVLLGCWALAQGSPAAHRGKDKHDAAKERFFFYITISPEPCTSPSGKSGICRSALDCSKLRAVSEGRCAWGGLGVCCLTAQTASTQTCNSQTSATQSTFVNRNYPNTETAALGSCTMTVTPSSGTCQLRLDFTDFSLGQPDNEGVCVTDYFRVTGGSTVPRICGQNTGQHMYVDATAGTNVVLDAVTQSVGEKWNIKVTQIPCSSADRAPSGCLQYYTGTSGTITSFNYNPTSTSGTRQLASQSYGVCIKPQSGYCSVTYRQATGSPFSLSYDPSSLPPSLPAPPSVGTDCTTDYLLIPGATIVDTSGFAAPAPTTADRFCGLAFPGATTAVQPYILNFVSDGNEISSGLGDSNNVGFRLTYTLNPCR